LKSELRDEKEKMEILGTVIHNLKEKDMAQIVKDLRMLTERVQITSESCGKNTKQVNLLTEWKSIVDDRFDSLQRTKADKEDVDKQLMLQRTIAEQHDNKLDRHAQLLKALEGELELAKRNIEEFKGTQLMKNEEISTRIEAIVGKINDILGVLVLFENKLWDEEQKMAKLSDDVRKQIKKTVETVIIHENDHSIGAQATFTATQSTAASAGAATWEPLIRKRSAFRCLSCDREFPCDEVHHANINSSGKLFNSTLMPRPQLEKNLKNEIPQPQLTRDVQEIIKSKGTAAIANGGANSPRRPKSAVLSPRVTVSQVAELEFSPEEKAKQAATARAAAAIPLPHNLPKTDQISVSFPKIDN
jgi:hypothetical protein